MADNKKSFIAYSDWHGMFKVLPNEVAGKLIKHVFSYVNDENPKCDDYVINALFEQIKATLKRDLKKWDKQREQRILAGKRSAEVRATKSNERSTVVNETQRKSTVSVSDSVNVSESDNKKYIKDINSRKQEFYNSLLPYLNTYPKELLKDFYEYWTEHGEKDRKFRKEKEKSFNTDLRLKTWAKLSKQFKINNSKPEKKNAGQILKEKYGLNN